MICWAFFAIPALLLFAWFRGSRRLVCLILAGVLTISLIFPNAAYAQFGLIGGRQNLLNLINGTIRQALSGIGAVTAALQNLHQQIVWPVQLIQRARSTIGFLSAQYRTVLQNLYRIRVHSATLPVPVDLEAVMRNGQTDDFNALASAYYRIYGSVPDVTDVDPAMRKLTDIDDAMALATLKTLKASDRNGELTLQTGNNIEDQARAGAPGSAPFLTAASASANIQSQAMMQKMFATMIRQEAAKVAHDNAKPQTLCNASSQRAAECLRHAETAVKSNIRAEPRPFNSLGLSAP